MSLELDRGKDGAENLIGNNNKKISSSAPCNHPRVSASRRRAMGICRQRHEEAFNGSTKLRGLKPCKTAALVLPGKKSLRDLFHQDSLCCQASSGLAATSVEGTLTSRQEECLWPPVLYVRAMPNRSSWLHIITCIV